MYSEVGIYIVFLMMISVDGCINIFSVILIFDGEDDGFISNLVFLLISSIEEVVILQVFCVVFNLIIDCMIISWEVDQLLVG